jgi:hypothetical protein
MHLATPYYRAFNIAVIGLEAMAIAGGLAEPGSLPGNPDALGWVMLAAALVLILRAARLGITVTPHTVVVRSWFITRRIPRHDVLNARAAPYDGLLNGGVDSGWLNQLELEIRGREWPLSVRAIVATRRSRRVQRIAYRLRELTRGGNEQ